MSLHLDLDDIESRMTDRGDRNADVTEDEVLALLAIVKSCWTKNCPGGRWTDPPITPMSSEES